MSKARIRPGDPWTERLARFVVRRRLFVVAAFLGLLVAGGIGAIGLPGTLSGGGWYAPGSQSSAVAAATRDGFVGRSQTTVQLVVTDAAHRDGDPAFATRTDEVYRTVTGRPDLRVESAYGWSTLGSDARGSFLGRDTRTVLTTLGIDLDDGTARRELPAIQSELTARYAGTGLTVTLVGAAPLWGEINHASEQGLVRAEILTLPVLALIMLLLYRGLTPALLSTVVAGSTVVLTYGVLSVVVRFVELSVFVQNAATMLGLGVAVDYSLFINSRFREERAAGARPGGALVTTMRTAGVTVLSSGATVSLAMATLFVVDLPVIRSLAIGAVTAVVVAVVVNLLLLPALLMVVARRPSYTRRPARARHASTRDGVVRRATATVMRRPVLALLCGLGLLLALAVPAHRLSTFTPDARIVPADTAVRTGYDQVRAQFGIGAASPVVVVVSADVPLARSPSATAVVALPARLAALDNVLSANSAIPILAAVDPAAPLAAADAIRRGTAGPDAAQTVGHFLSADGRTMVVELVPTDAAASTETRTLVEEARSIAAGVAGGTVRVSVGGETAEGIDGNAVIEQSVPLVLGLMLAAIFLLLLLTFRSVALPVKAILLNLASVAATYGVLVVVFQDGAGAGPLGFEATGQITNFVPIVLLTLLFSLSTDYEVFLLSRVREETLAGYENRAAVTRGMVATAPLISGAAFLMVAVFTAFTFTGVLPVQQLGLGMAVAVALDATVVRLVLVPASMRLMGQYNWWWPRLPGRRVHLQHIASRHRDRQAAHILPALGVSPEAQPSSFGETGRADLEGLDRGMSWTAGTASRHR